MIGASATKDRTLRVATVLARATSLSEELRGTIRELEAILRNREDEQESDR